MALNPLYGDAINKQNGEGGGGKFPKLPALRFNNIGDKFQGTIVRVSDPFETEDEWKGVKRTVTKQVVEYKDISMIRVDGEGNDLPAEKIDAANFWLSKTGHFAAIGKSLIEIEKGDLTEVIGASHLFKWSGLGDAVGDGARPHKFASKIIL